MDKIGIVSPRYLWLSMINTISFVNVRIFYEENMLRKMIKRLLTMYIGSGNF